MLAQSFKCATDLGLNDKQYDALIEVLALLETEEITLFTVEFRGPPHRRDKNYFNMAKWLVNYPQVIPECGTVGCIAGNACIVAQDVNLFDRFQYEGELNRGNRRGPLSRLFYPDITGYSDITPQQAATALRSFLTTGDVNWPAITGRSVGK